MIFFYGRCKGIRIVCPWTNLMRAVQSLTCDRSNQGHPSKLAAILPWHWMQRPKYAGEIWKRTFVSTVRPTVHTNPFRKPSSTRKNLKMPAFFVSVWTERILNEAFRTRWRHYNHVISLSEFSSNTNPKWPVIIAFLNSHVDTKTLDSFSEWIVLFVFRHKTSSASQNN